MRNLLVGERLRNYPDDASSLFQARVGQDAHETDIAAAIHKLDAAPAKQPPNCLRGLPINWGGSQNLNRRTRKFFEAF